MSAVFGVQTLYSLQNQKLAIAGQSGKRRELIVKTTKSLWVRMSGNAGSAGT